VLVLSGEEDGDEYLIDSPLDGNDRHQSEYGVRSVPKFEEPEEFEEGYHPNQREDMRQGSYHGPELGPRLHHRPKHQGNEEQGEENGRIPRNWTYRHDGDPDKSAGILQARLGVREGLDEHVRDDENYRDTDGPKNFNEYDRGP